MCDLSAVYGCCEMFYHISIFVVQNSFLTSLHSLLIQSPLPLLSVFLLPMDVTDLQQHPPAVLEGSERGVGCAGRGRSAPRVLLLPLGGALSPHWW